MDISYDGIRLTPEEIVTAARDDAAHVGGLSILGTTGIVRPFSCAAWIASIHRGVDVLEVLKEAHAILEIGH